MWASFALLLLLVAASTDAYNSYSYQQFAARIGFRYRHGDCPGNDISAMAYMNLESCSNRCKTTSGCVAFLWNEANHCYVKRKSCANIDTRNSRNHFFDKTSSAYSSATYQQFAARIGFRYRHGDCPGNDISAMAYMNLQSCSNRCKTTSGCVAFLWNEANHCYVKRKSCASIDTRNSRNHFFDKTSSAPPQTPATEIMILVESSKLMGAANFARAKNYAESFINALNVGSSNDRVAMASFATSMSARYVEGPSMRKDFVASQVRYLVNYGGSDLSLKYTLSNSQSLLYSRIHRGYTPAVLVILGSGRKGGSDKDSDITAQINWWWARGVKVYYVSAGTIDRTAIGKFVLPQNIFEMSRTSVNTIVGSIRKDVACGSNKISQSGRCTAFSPCALQVCAGNARCATSGLGFTCQCESGFIYQADYGCQAKKYLDLAFIIDVSSAVSTSSMQKTKSFIKGLLDGFYVTSSYVRVCIVMYNSQVPLILYFNQGANRYGLDQIIDKMTQYRGGNSNALTYVLQNIESLVFNPRRGSRTSVPHVAYLFTSGSISSTQLVEFKLQLFNLYKLGITMPVLTTGSTRLSTEVTRVFSMFVPVIDLYRVTNINVVITRYITTTVQGTACQKGTAPDSRGVCQDINECTQFLGICGEGSTCTNTRNSYSCSCRGSGRSYVSGQGCLVRTVMDLVIALDNSNKVSGSEFNANKLAALDLVKSLDVSASYVRVLIAAYSDYLYTYLTLTATQKREDAVNAITRVPYRGTAINFYSALYNIGQTAFRGARRNANRVVLFMGSGQVEYNHDSNIIQLGHQMLGQSINMIMVGGRSISPVISKFVFAENIMKLTTSTGIVSTILTKIIDSVSCSRGQYRVGSTCKTFNICSLQGLCGGGSACQATSAGAYTCKCGTDFQYGGAELGCQASTQLDIVFLVDISDSLGRTNLEKAKEFLRDFVKSSYIASNYIRVAILGYSERNLRMYQLLRSRQSSQFSLAVVNQMSIYPGAPGNLLYGLQQALEQFKPQNGARSNVPKTLYLISSGVIDVNSMPQIRIELSRLHNIGIRVPVTTVGTNVNINIMREIAFPFGVVDITRTTSTQITKIVIDIVTTVVKNAKCAKGQYSKGGRCVDIDECVRKPCPRGAKCTNIVGSYKCSCAEGLKLTTDGCLALQLLDIVFVVDVSPSQGQANLNRAKKFMVDYVNGLVIGKEGANVGIIGYSHEPFVASWLVDSRDYVLKAINQLKISGGNPSDLSKALPYLNERVLSPGRTRRGAKKLAILLTAGTIPQTQITFIRTQMDILRQLNINVPVVPVVPSTVTIDFSIFKQITLPSLIIDIKTVIDSKNPIEIITNVIINIIKQTDCKKGYVFDGNVCVDFNECELPKTCAHGATCKNTDGGYTCVCKRGFRYESTGCAALQLLDIVFVVDVSPSQGQANLNRAKKFMVDYVNGLVIGKEGANVGIIGYSHEPFVASWLVDSRDYVLKAINQLKISGGNPSDLSKALPYLNERVLSPGRTRRGAKKLAILLTAGTIPQTQITFIRTQMDILRQLNINVPVVPVVPSTVTIDFSIFKQITLPSLIIDIKTVIDSKNPIEIITNVIINIIKQTDCKKGYVFNGKVCVDFNECELPKTCAHGATCKNTDGGYTCVCKRGFRYESTGCAALQLIDIVFVVDVSPSQGQANLNRAKKFMVDYVNGLVIGKEGANVGIIGYSHVPFVASWLVDSRDYVLKAINQLKISGGNPSDLSKALPYLNERVLSPGRTRRGAKKLAILLTAGTIPQTQITFIRTQMDILRQLNINVPVVPVVPSTVTIDFSIFKQITLPSLIIDIKTVIDSKNPIEIITNVIINIIKQTDCKKGYVFDGKVCVDFNECELPKTCAHGATCKNTDGGYTCVCKRGFRYESTGCADIDECRTSPCKQGATCENTAGARKCNCKNGFTYDDIKGCIDINECLKHPCKQGATCENTAGAHKCNCKNGFTYDDIKGCIDINECLKHPCKQGATCENTAGAHKCNCKNGFTYDDIKGCIDINECLKHPCKQGATCENTAGAHKCNCKNGFTYDDIKGCIDINECLKHPCKQGATCENTAGAHKCNCKNGFTYDDIKGCIDIDECQLEPKSCKGNASCTNTPGSYKCGCAVGYIYDASTGCQDFNECHAPSGPSPCKGYSAKCSNTIGSYKCSCNVGYVYDGDTEAGCVDIDECNVGKPCKEGATCQNIRGSFKCNCKTGHKYNQVKGCVDIDECLTHPCKQGATCENTVGAHKCNCKNGFTYDDIKGCIDIDECQLEPKSCKGNASCTNTPGSYKCGCAVGYIYDASTGCQDFNECHAPSGPSPCKGYSAKCSNTIGSYRCSCNVGYVYDGDTEAGCVDINECNVGKPCKEGATCQNIRGSFKCNCKTGHKYNQVKGCVDIDECLTQPCKQGATCENTKGAHKCNCKNGFTYDEVKGCIDIDECQLEPKSCKGNASCTNTPGSYKCGCAVGYFYDASTGCQDFNECHAPSGPSPCKGYSAKCSNTIGSYRCSCNVGYVYDGDTEAGCVDIDECNVGKPCKEGAKCQNIRGSFKCNCKTGHKYNQVKGCVDIDECLTQPCKQGATCENTAGAHKCNCKNGFTYDDIKGCLATRKLDVVFVVEVSSNVKEIELKRFKEVITETIEQFHIHKDYVRVGLMTYAASPKSVVFLSDFKSQDELSLAVKSLQLDGSTPDVVNALVFLKDQMLSMITGARENVSKEVFYLTSGKVPKTQIDMVQIFIRQIHEINIGINTITTGKDFDLEFVQTLSFPRTVHTIFDIKNLYIFLSTIIVNVVGQTSCDSGNQFKDGKCVDIDECLNKFACGVHATCSNKPGTYVCTCPKGYRHDVSRGCIAEKCMDVVFLVDGSDTMGKVEYTKALDFIQSFVRGLAIGPEDVRVAIAVAYGTKVMGLLKLNKYQSYEGVMAVLSQLKFPGGEQNLVWALDKLHSGILVKENGAREDTPRMLFLLTNGNILASQTEIAVEVEHLRAANVRTFTILTSPQSPLTEVIKILSFPFGAITIEEIKLSIFKFTTNIVVGLSCTQGYHPENGHCVDDNECLMPKICAADSRCENRPGSFVCKCIKGYVYSDKRGCVGDVKMDLAIVVENSDRMTAKSMVATKALIKGLINNVAIDAEHVHVALANIFGASFMTNLRLNSTQSWEQFVAATESIEFKGTPNTDVALQVERSYDLLLAEGVGGRKNVLKTIIVVLADSLSGEAAEEFQASLQKYRKLGIRVYVANVNLSPSSKPQSDVEMPAGSFVISDIKFVERFAIAIVKSILGDSKCKRGYHMFQGKCQDIDECQFLGICRGGAQCHNIKASYKCTCREGFSYDPLVGCVIDGKLDLVFAVDGSDDMGTANFDKAKKLMADVVRHMRLGPDSINFVIVVYNQENTFSIVQAQQGSSNALSAQAVQKIKYPGGKPDLITVLNGLKQHVFVAKYGMRVGVAKAVLVLSSGSFTDKTKTATAAMEVQQSGVLVYSVILNEKKYTDCSGMFYGGFTFKLTTFSIHTFLTRVVANSLCKNGFKSVNGKCVDIDECQLDGLCETGSTCQNIAGSYECTCPAGYSYEKGQGCSKSSYIGIGGGTVVTTCKMNGKTYQLGSQWVEDCVTYVCAGAAGPVSIGIKCRGSDGKCYGLGVDHPFFDPNAKKEVTCSCAQTPKGIKRSCRTAKK